jgi:hypothetical protein
MKTTYLVEVSAKYSERADFQQLIQPVLVGEEELYRLLEEFRVLKGESMTLNGLHSFYSEEKRYPFHRLLILDNESNFGQKATVDKLLVNLCSFVHFDDTPSRVEHELTANT